MATKKKLPEDCMPKCQSCAFLQMEPGADAGFCRRLPPQIVASDEGEWSGFPMVSPDDWCGEFKRKLQG